MFIYDHCGTLKNSRTIRKEQGMKFPVLWLSFVSLWEWVGTEKGICLAWDLVSRSRITLHFGAKAVKEKKVFARDDSRCLFITLGMFEASCIELFCCCSSLPFFEVFFWFLFEGKLRTFASRLSYKVLMYTTHSIKACVLKILPPFFV